ncbi:MAG: L-histidine N(alpha)-methyltransferase [Bacteroidota bacterium]
MINTFAEDVLKGLTSTEKYLPSKYFYDDNGSRIFQEIMNMPEYYLTDSEFEILSLQAKQIVDKLEFSEPFNIIELGAGDGFKTFKLLEFLVSNEINFTYVPIDISEEANRMLEAKLKDRLPELSIEPKTGDYFKVLKQIRKKETPNLLLFLGGNIGNYPKERALNLLRLLSDAMNPKDKLLIGMDLKKNPIIIHNAYYDRAGITKRFNLNLLIRINRELDADFKIDDFDFYCHYNPENGKVKSYLVSLKKQAVQLKSIGKVLEFDQNELIWTELSKKYDQNEIDTLARLTNFKVKHSFMDCKHFFTDSLWEKS